MTLFGESTVQVSKKTGQMIICIPARMVQDSQFGFKAGDKVHITYMPTKRQPVIVVHRQRSPIDIKIRRKQQRSRWCDCEEPKTRGIGYDRCLNCGKIIRKKKKETTKQ